MSEQENISAQERFGKVVNSGKIDDLREVISAEVIDHDPAPEQ